jgi:hypothetical protein
LTGCIIAACCYLQEAVKHCEYWRLADSKNKAPGLIGWWPQRAVTFVDNHDTGKHVLVFAAGAAAGIGHHAFVTHTYLALSCA